MSLVFHARAKRPQIATIPTILFIFAAPNCSSLIIFKRHNGKSAVRFGSTWVVYAGSFGIKTLRKFFFQKKI